MSESVSATVAPYCRTRQVNEAMRIKGLLQIVQSESF